MHIELRRWADVLVIAPLSANTLAKLAQVGALPAHLHPPYQFANPSIFKGMSTSSHVAWFSYMAAHVIGGCTWVHMLLKDAPNVQGMCDNLLTCIVRAWDTSKPLLVAPAMNTFMWQSPFTRRHLDDLQAILAARIIPPVSFQTILFPKAVLCSHL